MKASLTTQNQNKSNDKRMKKMDKLKVWRSFKEVQSMSKNYNHHDVEVSILLIISTFLSLVHVHH